MEDEDEFGDWDVVDAADARARDDDDVEEDADDMGIGVESEWNDVLSDDGVGVESAEEGETNTEGELKRARAASEEADAREATEADALAMHARSSDANGRSNAHTDDVDGILLTLVRLARKACEEFVEAAKRGANAMDESAARLARWSARVHRRLRDLDVQRCSTVVFVGLGIATGVFLLCRRGSGEGADVDIGRSGDAATGARARLTPPTPPMTFAMTGRSWIALTTHQQKDEQLSSCIKEDDVPPAARLTAHRMYALSFFPLAIMIYFIAIMIVEASAEFVGSGGLALLECIILRQTANDPAKARSLARISHLRSTLTMFLAISCSKAFSIMYSTYDACKMPEEALGELECSNLRWLTTFVLAIFGYITYVAVLQFARLELYYVVILARQPARGTKTPRSLSASIDGVV